jgi:hypothetical protein
MTPEQVLNDESSDDGGCVVEVGRWGGVAGRRAPCRYTPRIAASGSISTSDRGQPFAFDQLAESCQASTSQIRAVPCRAVHARRREALSVGAERELRDPLVVRQVECGRARFAPTRRAAASEQFVSRATGLAVPLSSANLAHARLIGADLRRAVLRRSSEVAAGEVRARQQGGARRRGRPLQPQAQHGQAPRRAEVARRP